MARMMIQQSMVALAPGGGGGGDLTTLTNLKLRLMTLTMQQCIRFNQKTIQNLNSSDHISV